MAPKAGFTAVWALTLGCAAAGFTSTTGVVLGAAVPGYTYERNGFQALGSANESRMFGWGFTALADFQIVALGVQDFGSDGFATPHGAYLWRQDQTLVRSLSFAKAPDMSGTFGANEIRYMTLPQPVVVHAGDRLVVGADWQPNANDLIFSGIATKNFVWDSRLAYTDGRIGVSLGQFPLQTYGSTPTSYIAVAAVNILIEPLECVADFNGDGFLTFEDFDGFVGAFEAGQARADFNADGFLTFEDFDGFVNALEAGC